MATHQELELYFLKLVPRIVKFNANAGDQVPVQYYDLLHYWDILIASHKIEPPIVMESKQIITNGMSISRLTTVKFAASIYDPFVKANNKFEYVSLGYLYNMALFVASKLIPKDPKETEIKIDTFAPQRTAASLEANQLSGETYKSETPENIIDYMSENSCSAMEEQRARITGVLKSAMEIPSSSLTNDQIYTIIRDKIQASTIYADASHSEAVVWLLDNEDVTISDIYKYQFNK